ncbi:MAG: 16S rRNA (guanine(527)-N(7))-methyltransferase RsmG [Pirellulales bacterium]|nr:16S rRNA (guanine(527)-N(7))-methyltransferase RsmG [Pirellulales bacterium]
MPNTLADALAKYEIDLDSDQIEMLDRYARALWRWNEKINLTRHTDYEKFVSRDVVDAVQIEAFIDSGDRVLDVGTGGGLPGAILSVLRPDLEITLCDSVAKKAKATTEIVQVAELALPVVHGRAEEIVAAARQDTLVARAVAPLKKLLRWFEPCWDDFGQLLLVKGPAWVDERGEARHLGLLKRLELRCLASYPMTGTESESVILRIRPKGRS